MHCCREDEKRKAGDACIDEGWTAVAGYVRVFKCVRVKASGRWEGGVSRQAYHPRSPPVNSGGQTISLIEFNPGSPQEARRMVALLSMERVGGEGWWRSRWRRELCACRLDEEGFCRRDKSAWRGKKNTSTRSRERTRGCRGQQRREKQAAEVELVEG